MTLLEVAIITGTSFNERLRPHGKIRNTWLFSLQGVEVKEGSLLAGSYGVGRTLAAAKKDYAKKLQSKLIVVNAMKPDRHEYLLPPKITS